MPSDDSIEGVEIPSGRWKREGSEKSRKDTTRHNEVCNTFHNEMLTLIIINFYIKFGTSNVIQHLLRLSDTSKDTKARLKKIGQHKLGPGAYSNLAAQIVSIKKSIMHPNNKLQIIFLFIAPQNVKIMMLCKYVGRQIQISSHR